MNKKQQKYAVFDEKGFPVSFYDSSIHHEIPENAIKITYSQWKEFIDHQGQRKWDGQKIITHTLPKPPDDILIAAIKREAALRIQQSGHDWMAAREVTTGQKVPNSVIEYAIAVRQASNDLESALEQDFTDDKHWPDRLQGNV